MNSALYLNLMILILCRSCTCFVKQWTRTVDFPRDLLLYHSQANDRGHGERGNSFGYGPRGRSDAGSNKDLDAKAGGRARFGYGPRGRGENSDTDSATNNEHYGNNVVNDYNTERGYDPHAAHHDYNEPYRSSHHNGYEYDAHHSDEITSEDYESHDVNYADDYGTASGYDAYPASSDNHLESSRSSQHRYGYEYDSDDSAVGRYDSHPVSSGSHHERDLYSAEVRHEYASDVAVNNLSADDSLHRTVVPSRNGVIGGYGPRGRTDSVDTVDRTQIIQNQSSHLDAAGDSSQLSTDYTETDLRDNLSDEDGEIDGDSSHESSKLSTSDEEEVLLAEPVEAPLSEFGSAEASRPSEKLGASFLSALMALSMTSNIWFVAAASLGGAALTDTKSELGSLFRDMGSQSFQFLSKMFLTFAGDKRVTKIVRNLDAQIDYLNSNSTQTLESLLEAIHSDGQLEDRIRTVGLLEAFIEREKETITQMQEDEHRKLLYKDYKRQLLMQNISDSVNDFSSSLAEKVNMARDGIASIAHQAYDASVGTVRDFTELLTASTWPDVESINAEAIDANSDIIDANLTNEITVNDAPVNTSPAASEVDDLDLVTLKNRYQALVKEFHPDSSLSSTIPKDISNELMSNLTTAYNSVKSNLESIDIAVAKSRNANNYETESSSVESTNKVNAIVPYEKKDNHNWRSVRYVYDHVVTPEFRIEAERRGHRLVEHLHDPSYYSKYEKDLHVETHPHYEYKDSTNTASTDFTHLKSELVSSPSLSQKKQNRNKKDSLVTNAKSDQNSYQYNSHAFQQHVADIRSGKNVQSVSDRLVDEASHRHHDLRNHAPSEPSDAVVTASSNTTSKEINYWSIGGARAGNVKHPSDHEQAEVDEYNEHVSHMQASKKDRKSRSGTSQRPFYWAGPDDTFRSKKRSKIDWNRVRSSGSDLYNLLQKRKASSCELFFGNKQSDIGNGQEVPYDDDGEDEFVPTQDRKKQTVGELMRQSRDKSSKNDREQHEQSVRYGVDMQKIRKSTSAIENQLRDGGAIQANIIPSPSTSRYVTADANNVAASLDQRNRLQRGRSLREALDDPFDDDDDDDAEEMIKMVQQRKVRRNSNLQSREDGVNRHHSFFDKIIRPFRKIGGKDRRSVKEPSSRLSSNIYSGDARVSVNPDTISRETSTEAVANTNVRSKLPSVETTANYVSRLQYDRERGVVATTSTDVENDEAFLRTVRGKAGKNSRLVRRGNRYVYEPCDDEEEVKV